MGRHSSIQRLDPRIREAVDALIRDGADTIEEIVATIRAMGGQASTSAVQRYRAKAEEALPAFRASQEIAKVWAAKIEEGGSSDVSRLASQVLGSVAFSTAQGMLASGEAMPANEVMFLAKALDHISRADKTNLDRDLRIRKEVAAEALKRVESGGRKASVTAEQLAIIRQEVYGLAP